MSPIASDQVLLYYSFMTGILLALLSAISLTLADAGKKKMLQHFPAYLIIWANISLALFVNSLYLGFSDLPMLNWTPILYLYLPCLLLLVACDLLFLKSIASGEFSLVMPFIAFGPVFSLFFGLFFLGESTNNSSTFGIFLVMLGAYTMFADSASSGGVWAPFVSIVKQPGPRYMILASISFALIMVLQKIGARHSSPLFFWTLLLYGEFFVFTLLLLKSGIAPLTTLRPKKLLTLVSSILWTLGLNSFYISTSYTLIAYASSVKQVQLVLSCLAGFFIFKEKSGIKRLASSALLMLGVAIIILTSA